MRLRNRRQRMARRFRTPIITAALAAGAFSFGMVNAPSALADDVETFRNQATGGCLDVTTVTYMHETSVCHAGYDSMEWSVHVWKDGTRELKSVAFGECLDDSNGAGLRIYPCNASTYQSWFVHRWNDGSIELKNQATGRCLDDSGAGLRTYACNASTYQSWF